MVLQMSDFMRAALVVGFVATARLRQESGQNVSKFAIIGDIHSSKKDLQAVLQHVRKVDPQAEVVGTGDIFECTISKKKLPLPEPLPYEDV